MDRSGPTASTDAVQVMDCVLVPVEANVSRTTYLPHSPPSRKHRVNDMVHELLVVSGGAPPPDSRIKRPVAEVGGLPSPRSKHLRGECVDPGLSVHYGAWGYASSSNMLGWLAK